MSTAVKTNGKRNDTVACRHSPGCPVVAEQQDIKAVLEVVRKEQIELRTLIQSTAMQITEDNAHVQAVTIDENEKTRALVMRALRKAGLDA